MFDTNALSQMLRNPYSHALRQHLDNVLGIRGPRNEEIIDRLCHFLATKSDAESFIRLVIDVYDAGLTEAVRQNAEQLSKLGYEVEIVKPKPKVEEVEEIVRPPKPKIFNQEKSG